MSLRPEPDTNTYDSNGNQDQIFMLLRNANYDNQYQAYTHKDQTDNNISVNSL